MKSSSVVVAFLPVRATKSAGHGGLGGAEHFCWRAASVHVVDGPHLNLAFVINKNGATEGATDCVVAHTEVSSDVLGAICDDVVVDATWEDGFIVEPSVVGMPRVGGASNHSDAVVSEFLFQLLEADNFGWADEREVERIPVHEVPLALHVVAADVDAFAADVGSCVPSWCGFSDHVLHVISSIFPTRGGIRTRRRLNVAFHSNGSMCTICSTSILL